MFKSHASMFYVYDCTTKIGYTFKTRFGCLALLGAELLTLVTGRFHDFSEASELEYFGRLD